MVLMNGNLLVRKMESPRTYLFSELGKQHQNEIVGNLGREVAEKTVWELVPDYPVDEAAAWAWDTAIMIHDDDVESLMGRIKRQGVLRPILIDTLHADEEGEGVWMEGRHRSIASEQLGLKTIPALYRIE
jgi:hypothetical protein